MEQWEARLLARYNLTGEQYAALLLVQGGGCAVCGKTPEANKQRLAVDHNHKVANSVIRGLLCKFCNAIVIAHWADNPKYADGVVRYLSDPPGPRTLGAEHRVPVTTAARPRSNRMAATYQQRLLQRDEEPAAKPGPKAKPGPGAKPGTRAKSKSRPGRVEL